VSRSHARARAHAIFPACLARPIDVALIDVSFSFRYALNRRSLFLLSIGSPSPSPLLSPCFLPAVSPVVYPLVSIIVTTAMTTTLHSRRLTSRSSTLDCMRVSAIRATYATLTSDCTLRLLVSLLIFTTRETITITHRKLDTPLARRLRTPCCAFPSPLSLSHSLSLSTSLARLRRCNVGRVSMTVTTTMMPMTARRLVRAAFDVDGDRFLDENVYPTVWTRVITRNHLLSRQKCRQDESEMIVTPTRLTTNR